MHKKATARTSTGMLEEKEPCQPTYSTTFRGIDAGTRANIR